MELLLELNADADIQDEVRILSPFYTLCTDALIENRTIFSWLHIRSSYFDSIFIAVSIFLFFQKSCKSLCTILFIYSIGCVQVWMWMCLNLIILYFYHRMEILQSYYVRSKPVPIWCKFCWRKAAISTFRIKSVNLFEADISECLCILFFRLSIQISPVRSSQKDQN